VPSWFCSICAAWTGWQHEAWDPVPELTPGRPPLYLQLRGGHALAGDLPHAVLSGPMSIPLLCVANLFTSSLHAGDLRLASAIDALCGICTSPWPEKRSRRRHKMCTRTGNNHSTSSIRKVRSLNALGKDGDAGRGMDSGIGQVCIHVRTGI
jgi:hypothetical protein